MKLNGQTALVTGGAHRLGRAIALALAAAGTHVAIHYHRSAAPAEATLAELRALGVEATAIQGDLSVVARSSGWSTRRSATGVGSICW